MQVSLGYAAQRLDAEPRAGNRARPGKSHVLAVFALAEGVEAFMRKEPEVTSCRLAERGA